MSSLWLEGVRPSVDDELPDGRHFEALVVGAGLTGLTTALLLARAGRRVAVVEARRMGALTTGHTTAKVSLLQGTKLSRILGQQPRSVGEQYVDANREGMAWLLRFCADHAVPVQRRDAVTFAAERTELPAVRREHDAARALGLPVEWVDGLDVPFPVAGATRLADQAQLHPLELLAALAEQVRVHGGTLHEQCRVVGVSKSSPPVVELSDGRVATADQVVVATGIPILDRGLHFAKLAPQRSYLVAFSGVSQELPMCLSAGQVSRSVRDVPGVGMLAGGSGHAVGRTRSEQAHLDDVRRWAQQWFPDAVQTHAWSAQDYRPYEEVPLVGRLPLADGRVFVATGYDKWGMTNAVAAAHSITAEILGGTAPHAQAQWFNPGALSSMARINATVAFEMLRRPRPERRCTHLGGPLKWNDAEETWDCPLHGSRFGSDGCVIEGPATRPLDQS